MDWQSYPSDPFGIERLWDCDSDAPRSAAGGGSRAEVRPKRWVLHAGHGGGAGASASSSYGPHFGPGSGPSNR